MNDSELPANYELLAQVVEDVTPILYSSPEPKASSFDNISGVLVVCMKKCIRICYVVYEALHSY